VKARVYAVVFVGAAIGGAARLGIDLLIDTDRWSWDIMVINLVGSALLGGVLGWYSAHAAPWWLPGVGPGALGGFTTFSAMAEPHPDAARSAAVLLFVTLVGAAAAAAFGWWAGDSIALKLGAHERGVDADRVEADVEGYHHEEAQS